MTDKEIIKALECCSKDDCDNCPNAFGNCYANLARQALELIKSKDKTIDWFATAKQAKERRVFDVFMNRTRVDTIKEFGERVKQEIDNALESNYKVKSQWLEKTNIDNETMVRYIDGKIDCLLGLNMFVHNLVKEMVGN